NFVARRSTHRHIRNRLPRFANSPDILDFHRRRGKAPQPLNREESCHMLYIVRGKNSNHDRSLRIHAESAAEAEAIGWKREPFVTRQDPALAAHERTADPA